MTQARQAERSIPQAAFLFPAALAAALVLGLIVAFGMIALPRVDVGTLGNVTSSAVVQSGQDWQAQRIQQSTYEFGLIQSGYAWETQRAQQSTYGSALTLSGVDWEAQRRQQSGDTGSVTRSGAGLGGTARSAVGNHPAMNRRTRPDRPPDWPSSGGGRVERRPDESRDRAGAARPAGQPEPRHHPSSRISAGEAATPAGDQDGPLVTLRRRPPWWSARVTGHHRSSRTRAA